MEKVILPKRKLEERMIMMGEKTPDSHDIEKKRSRDSADALDDKNRSDPLCLAGMVVDRILEHLDDRSLLTGRLVCQSWNAEITSRNHLWKQRCQRKPVFRFDLNTTPLDDVFHQYVLFHHVYHRMRSGDAFQVDTHSEALDCYSDAGDDRSLSQISERRTFSEDWNDSIKKIFYFHTDLLLGKNTVIVLTLRDELILADLKTQEKLWRQRDVHIFFYNHFCHHIYAVTLSGDVKLFSLEGKCRLQIDTGGKLTEASTMSVHPSGCFILVGLDKDEVYMVYVDTKQVIQLQVTFPEIPEEEEESDDENDTEEDDEGTEDEEEEVEEQEEKEKEEEEEEVEEEEEEDIDPCLEIGFMLNDSLSCEQLAICLCKKLSVVVAIINTNGKIVHQASKTFSQWISWNGCEIFNSLENHFMVRTIKGVQKYAIHCKPSGIQFTRLWQKPFPRRMMPCYVQTLKCGDQFILGQEGHGLLLCRLSDGRLVVSIPGFFRRRFNSSSNGWHLIDVSADSPEHVARRVQVVRAHRCRIPAPYRHLYVYLNNTSWLDGLSPDTTKPDAPVLLYVSDADTGIKCLRWAADLWTGKDLQVQQLERGKEEAGLGLHAQIIKNIVTHRPPRRKKAD